MTRENVIAAWAALRARSRLSPKPAPCARSSKSCATQTRPSARAAPRTKKVKTLLKSSDATGTCNMQATAKSDSRSKTAAMDTAPLSSTTRPVSQGSPTSVNGPANIAPTEQLKIVIVGHVDHGKSTFVGRLFHDTGSLPEGKLEQLQQVAERRGVPFEWANLMDALQSERDQNITIDTAQIWFQTKKR